MLVGARDAPGGLLCGVHPPILVDGLCGIDFVMQVSNKYVAAFEAESERMSAELSAFTERVTHSPRGLGRSLLVY